MDAAMKALKRAARALLKDELDSKRHRQEASSAKAVDALVKVSELELKLARAQVKLDDARRLAAEYSARTVKASSWLFEMKRRPHHPGLGPLEVQALAEWLVQGDSGSPTNTHGLHPFDKWQVSPKP